MCLGGQHDKIAGKGRFLPMNLIETLRRLVSLEHGKQRACAASTLAGRTSAPSMRPLPSCGPWRAKSSRAVTLARQAALDERLQQVEEAQDREELLVMGKAMARMIGAREGRSFAENEAQIEIETGEGERDARPG
jgi:predicted transcriptional regulator